MYTLAFIVLTFIVAGMGGFLTARNTYKRQQYGQTKGTNMNILNLIGRTIKLFIARFGLFLFKKTAPKGL